MKPGGQKNIAYTPRLYGKFMWAIIPYKTEIAKLTPTTSLKAQGIRSILRNIYKTVPNNRRFNYYATYLTQNSKFLVKFLEDWGEKTVGNGKKYESYEMLGQAAGAARVTFYIEQDKAKRAAAEDEEEGLDVENEDEEIQEEVEDKEDEMRKVEQEDQRERELPNIEAGKAKKRIRKTEAERLAGDGSPYRYLRTRHPTCLEYSGHK